MAMADSAYSNAALPPHTDTTYFTEPAGLQAFHMLSHTPPPEGAPEDGNIGGQSFLVDGFAVTNDLWRMDKSAFRALTAIPVPWHASGNEGVAIAPEKTFPVIELKDGYSGPIVSRIRWNESDRGSIPLTDTNGRLPEVWYNAARKFNRLVENQKYRFQLQPRRVLSKFFFKFTGPHMIYPDCFLFSIRQLARPPRQGCFCRAEAHVRCL